MDTINLVNVFGVVSGAGAVIFLGLLIKPIITEIRRPRNKYFVLRRRLIVEVLMVLILMTVRVPYFVSRLHVPYNGFWAGVVSIATGTVLFYFAYNKYKSYTFIEPTEKPELVFEKSDELKVLDEEAKKKAEA